MAKPEVKVEEVIEGTIPVSKARELMETAASRVVNRVLLALGVDQAVEPKELSKEVEEAVNALPVVDEVKASIRKDILSLSATDQAEWLKSFASLMANPLSFKVKAEEKPVEPVPAVSSEPVKTENKEEVMAAVKVEADVKQNMKSGDVPVAQDGAGAKQNFQKGEVSAIPGKVVTEDKLPIDVLPKAVKTGFELQTETEAMAKQSDKEINALKSAHGAKTENAKLASVLEDVKVIASDAKGLKLLQGFVAYAKKNAKKK